MASDPAQPKPTVSGLSTMSTPANPTKMASHCARFTRSPSMNIDITAISRGAMKNRE